MSLREDIINKLCSIFHRLITVDEVWLYGSRAKGSEKPYSDIDLTMIGENVSFDDLQTAILRIDDLLLPFKIDISIFSLIKSDSVREDINRHHVSIFKR